jgi:regulator of sigma E protease
MLAILAPLLVFGLVIFVHELGHFIAAKAVGVYAPRFSIGFGPSIFKWRRGETEYVLAWLPLGGYVRMASRHDAETAFLEGGSEEATAKQATDEDFDPNAMIPFGPKPVPEDRWFESKSLAARIVIMIAGVVMNIVLAVVVATAIAFHYPRIVYPSTVVGGVSAVGVPAEIAQIHSGDTVRAVNGEKVSTWNEVAQLIGTSSGSVTITTQRGDVKIPIGRAPDASERIIASLRPFARPVIDTVFAGEPAAAAGLRHGDSLVSVAGKPIHTWSDMVDEVSVSAGKTLPLVISRAGAAETLSITPKATRDTDPVSGVERTVGKIGAGTAFVSRTERLGLGEAISAGVRKTWQNAGFVFKVLHGIGTGAVSVRELGGPVAITKASVDAARNGFDTLLSLIALLSINVAVLNLLPIPILDGGQILINVLEAAKGKPFSLRTREYILRFGLVAIGLLFAIVMYNDLHTDVRDGLAKLFGWVGKLFGA